MCFFSSSSSSISYLPVFFISIVSLPGKCFSPYHDAALLLQRHSMHAIPTVFCCCCCTSMETSANHVKVLETLIDFRSSRSLIRLLSNLSFISMKGFLFCHAHFFLFTLQLQILANTNFFCYTTLGYGFFCVPCNFFLFIRFGLSLYCYLLCGICICVFGMHFSSIVAVILNSTIVYIR